MENFEKNHIVQKKISHRDKHHNAYKKCSNDLLFFLRRFFTQTITTQFIKEITWLKNLEMRH